MADTPRQEHVERARRFMSACLACAVDIAKCEAEAKTADRNTPEHEVWCCSECHHKVNDPRVDELARLFSEVERETREACARLCEARAASLRLNAEMYRRHGRPEDAARLVASAEGAEECEMEIDNLPESCAAAIRKGGDISANEATP